jgi:hypothetical protein
MFRTERGTPINPNHASPAFARLPASSPPGCAMPTAGLAQRVYIHQLPQTAPRVAGLIEGVFGPAARGAQVVATVSAGASGGGKPERRTDLIGW